MIGAPSPGNLRSNPFAILGLSTRDDREAIASATEERSLVLDADECASARSVLTNPRRRIEAEIGWLPGIAPSRIPPILHQLSAGSGDEIDLSKFDGLAKANVAAAIMANAAEQDEATVRALLIALSNAAEEIDADRLIRDINEEREVAGFSSITNIDLLEATLENQRRVWLEAVSEYLDRLLTSTLIEALSHAVEEAAKSGAMPRFLDDVVDGFALRIEPFLESETEGADALIAKATVLAGNRPDAIDPLIDGLADLLATWERVTKAVQTSLVARGQTHRPSHDLGWKVRDLSLTLFNEHDLVAETERVSGLVARYFSTLPDISERVSQDTQALADIATSRAQQAEDAAEFGRELAYSAEIGLIRKSRLSISVDGIEWRGERFARDEIEWCKWGALRRSTNGVPTGIEYLISFGNGLRSAQIDFSNGQIFEAFIPRLWKAVGPQIIVGMCRTLAEGGELRFGNVIVRDAEVLIQHKPRRGKGEWSQLGWDEVKVRTEDGAFVIFEDGNITVRGDLQYRETGNAHFIEHIIRTNFERGNIKMSELLA